MFIKCEYCLYSRRHKPPMAIVDCGANSGVAGDAVSENFKTSHIVDISGIYNHQVVDVPIGFIGGVATTKNGAVIAIIHQYELLGKFHQFVPLVNLVYNRSRPLIDLYVQSGLVGLPI
jgi:hypothetical protein